MKLLQYIVKSILLLAFTLFFTNSYAASIDHFEVTMSPERAKIWEAIDITIEAVDTNNNIITDYKWMILVFSESDPEADFPNVLKENSYTFLASDEWQVKFENAVKFQAIWTQDIHVYELEDETVVWLVEVEISGDDMIPEVEIEILSPENGITIWEDKVIVSWLTNKNYSVVIKINNETEVQTTSNWEWIFEETITWLRNWNNILLASILNSDWEVIWTSWETILRVESTKPRIKDLKITPEWDLTPRQKISIEMISNKWLSEVSVVINDVIIELLEENEWIYKATSNAPKEPWNYSVDTVLRDEIWHETKELWAETITVVALPIPVIPPVDTTEDPTDNTEVTPTIEEPPVEQFCTKKTKITWLKLTKLKTKSILNWDSVKDTSKYNVYKKLDDGWIELVKTVTSPVFSIDIIWDELKYEYFAIKAICNGDNDTEFEWSLSDATKIQTWPELIILWMLSIIFASLLLFYRRRA